MIDTQIIRADPEGVAASFKRKGLEVSFEEFLLWDKNIRELNEQSDTLRAKRNRVSAEIGTLKRQGNDTSAVEQEIRELGDDLRDIEGKLKEFSKKANDFLVALPNLPAEDIPSGGKENNEVVSQTGSKPTFDFDARDHIELATDLALIDYERGAKLGGKGFWVYRNEGALLEWALINYFISCHREAGFEFVLPPQILTYEGGYTAGQFPKFAEDVFALEGGSLEDETMQFLIPTAETALANLHRDEILKAESLPRKYFSYTPCFRKEAGGYGSSERGMIRGHQFNKVELFIYSKPSESEELLLELLAQGEKLMKGLGLHYQVSKLAAADCSASMAKTYDIEVWIPSMNVYKEVSSASNGTDFQARRGRIRYKDPESGKNTLVHTLNASGLATSRLFPAILEQNQRADGSVLVPEVLQPFLGKEVIEPKEG